MDDFYAAVFHVALFLLLYGLVSRTLKETLFVSEPLVSLVYGMIVGPQIARLLNTRYTQSKEVLFYVAKAVLCLQTMAAAMSLPHGYVLKNKRSLFSLVVVVGLAKYFVTGLLVFVFSRYNFAASMGIAACLTPTDPVLAASLIQSRFARDFVPERLKNLIQAESGINDGFGLLLMLIPADILKSKQNYASASLTSAFSFVPNLLKSSNYPSWPGISKVGASDLLSISNESGIMSLASLANNVDTQSSTKLISDPLTLTLVDSLTLTLVYRGIVAAVLGAGIGYVARRLLVFCSQNNMVGNETFLVYGLTLTFFVLGTMELLHMSELCGVFSAGTAFAWDEWFVFETRECRLQEIVDNLCTCSFFVLFGSRIDLSVLSPGLVVFAVATIVFRRPVICFFLQKTIPLIKNSREAFITGWLGPIGVGALYYSLYFDKLASTTTHASVSIVVMLSVFIHGAVMIILRALIVGKKYFREWGIKT